MFPKLQDNHAFPSEYNRKFLGRKAVLLLNTTLMRLLLIHFTSKANIDTTKQVKQASQGDALTRTPNAKSADMFGTQGHTRSRVIPTYNSSSSQHSEASQTTRRAGTTSQISLHTGRSNKKLKKRRPRNTALVSGIINTPHHKGSQENPILFLNIYTGLNKSIARTIIPGTTNKATFQYL